MTIRFLLVCEGSSDAALIPHISRLLVQYGQDDPEGNYWTRPNPLTNKIQEGLRYSGGCDLLFVHRDADASQETRSSGTQRRHDEIEAAVRDSGYSGPWVGIIPVRMTESWLLVDESAIRMAARRPHSSEPLSLPFLRQVESEADPKGRLQQALITASGASGRRLREFRRDIPTLRRQLLNDLPVAGMLEQVPSWARFRNDLLTVLATLGNDIAAMESSK